MTNIKPNSPSDGSGPIVRPVRREQPDLAKLARALIMLAQAKQRRQDESKQATIEAEPDSQEAA